MIDPLLTPTLPLAVPGSRLRPWLATDAAALAYYANDERVAHNLRDVFPFPYTAEDAEFFLSLVADNRRDIMLAIEVEGEPVGGISILFKTDVQHRAAEIGYWLTPAWWGHGLMTAAVRTLSSYVLANFDVCRLYAGVFETNPASARVLEKAGYELEARLRRSITKHGKTMDALMYALVV